MPANTSGSYDLAQTVKDKLSSSTLTNPRDIAKALVEDGDIPKSRYAEVLVAVLPDYVREHIRSMRRPARRQGANNMSQRYGSGYRYWRMYDGQEWVWLDNCDRDAVLLIANEYRRRAEENAHVADQYEALADLFNQFEKAKIVADLPETKVAEILEEVIEAAV